MKNAARITLLALVYAFVSDMDFRDHQMKDASPHVVQNQIQVEEAKLTGAEVLRVLKNRSIAAAKSQLSS